jgi:hypothetical protein
MDADIIVRLLAITVCGIPLAVLIIFLARIPKEKPPHDIGLVDRPEAYGPRPKKK